MQDTKEEENIENTNSHNTTAVRRCMYTLTTSPNTSWSHFRQLTKQKGVSVILMLFVFDYIY